jgi:quercetin dioxygenase-like cupin family protein
MTTTSYQNHILSTAQYQTFDVFGVQLQFLVTPKETGNQTSLYKGILPPGVVIPLHRHPDSEVFYVLEGALEVYQDSGEYEGWHSVLAGDVLAVAPEVKHALRNTSSAPSAVIAVTERSLYEFFREIAKPAQQGPSTPPSPEDMQRLFTVAAKYSYWMGSPEENAAVGIRLG